MPRFDEPPPAAAGNRGEILLFGVRVKVDPMRKSASMNNISEFLPVRNADGVNNNDEDFPKAAAAAAEDGIAAGYASADDAVPLPGNGGRDRKRGVPWTEEEHKLFLYGLQKVGKGNWRGISRDYVRTRTPTQVASHAQKYFFRRSNLSHRRRRSSVFDITTDSLAAMSIEKVGNQQDNQPVPGPTAPHLPRASNITRFPVVPFPANVGPVDRANNPSAILVRPVFILPMPTSSTVVDLQQVPIQPPPLSNVLSLTSGQDPYTRQILA
ncbi:DNA binding protein-like [Dorcoceras hygrometricum]|uniref:DNA binding protein-like n=1 Tax=Dorcoceras hygrometricum TaxID=472368 RepID=A0A2Z7DCJ8_9LAMI|nr:DNA binding protein-like [Dorcoceras hygrometricum]